MIPTFVVTIVTCKLSDVAKRKLIRILGYGSYTPHDELLAAPHGLPRSYIKQPAQKKYYH
jgi:hypothetical protein